MNIKKALKSSIEHTKADPVYVRFDRELHDEITRIGKELKVKDRSKIIRQLTQCAVDLYRGNITTSRSLEDRAIFTEFCDFLKKWKLSNLDVAELLIRASSKTSNRLDGGEEK